MENKIEMKKCRRILVDTNDIYGNKVEGDIYLVQQYYQDKNKERQKEIDYCLQRNLDNKYIRKIYLLNENKYDYSNLKNNNKIEEYVIGERLKYKKFIDFIVEKDGYFILSNSDIFYDESIEKIKYGLLGKMRSIYCLTRYEYDGKQIRLNNIIQTYSQDSWIIHSKFSKLRYNKLLDFSLGKPYCDNRLAYILCFDEKMKIINDCKNIKSYHYHESNVRNYHQIKDKINGAILHIKPYL